MSTQALVFTVVIVREDGEFVGICPELDIATQGRDLRTARLMLKEAVTGYLENCFESNLPYLRPIPRNEDPRNESSQRILKTFRLKVDLTVRVHG